MGPAFQVGDHVMMTTWMFSGIPQGARGTVTQIVYAGRNIYRVQFDDHPQARPVLMIAEFLTHAQDETDHAST